MARGHKIFRAYFNSTGEIWEATGIRFVYEAALRAMKECAHILGGYYTVHIYFVDERIEVGREDAEECVFTVSVDAGLCCNYVKIVKGFFEE